MKKDCKIAYLCGARDFHALDWYKSAKKNLPLDKLCVVVDIVSAEGMKSLVNDSDNVYKLFILDRFLFRKPSRIGDIWRNLFKLLVLPLQAFKLKNFYKKNNEYIFHAHGMYYMFMARLAKVPYVGTPQGSELLVRPYKSKFYKSFAIYALKGAKAVTVDSEAMRDSAVKISSVKPFIIQNGIDLKSILDFIPSIPKDNIRDNYLSIRGFTPLYREDVLLDSRNNSKNNKNTAISFIYPFFDNIYMDAVKSKFIKNDKVLGRLDRDNMYRLLSKTKIVFSIPMSDSSPRSVYESVFLGCVVIISPNKYYNILPKCMKERIVIANIDDPMWFDKSVTKALEIADKKFVPDEESIDMFDQNRSFLKIYNLLRN